MVTTPQYLMTLEIKAEIEKLLNKESNRIINLDQEKDALLERINAIVDAAYAANPEVVLL